MVAFIRRICIGLPMLLLVLPKGWRLMAIVVMAYLFICAYCSLYRAYKLDKGSKDFNCILVSAAICGVLTYAFYVRWVASAKLNNLFKLLLIPKESALILLCAILFLGATYSIYHVLYALVEDNRCGKFLREVGLTHQSLSAHGVKPIFISTYLASLICSFEFLRNVHGCADWFGEGYYLYIGTRWGFSLGRWLIGAVNASTMNVVMPILVVYVCASLRAISSLLIVDLLGIDSKLLSVLSTVSIVVAPAVVTQYLYIYMALAYGVALTLSVLCANVTLRGGTRHIVVSSALLALSLGCYQSYIGFTAGLILCSLIINYLRNDCYEKVLSGLKRSLVMGVVGVSLYMIVWKLLSWGLAISAADYGGASSVGVLNSLRCLPTSVTNSYVDFLSYYCDPSVVLWPPIACAMLFLIVALVIKRLYAHAKEKRCMGEVTTMLILVLLGPVALTLTDIAAPEHDFSILMSHQMQLVFPLLAALICLEEVGASRELLSRPAICLMIVALMLCTIRAFATYAVVDLSYRYVGTVTSVALQRVLDDEEYRVDDTIVFAGFPDETHLREAMPIYTYSYFKSQSAVFWHLPYAYGSWQPYVLSTFGMDIGTVDVDTMNAIATSEEFREMGCFPDTSSVGRIDGFSVVKFSDDCVIQ